MNNPMTLFILQLITAITASSCCGFLFKKIGQPAVIGEIVAGILLGPSLLGHSFPQLSNIIFPPASLGDLQVFSQVGLILFMFIVGLELDPGLVRKNAASAVVISHASIIIPFGMGILLSCFLYNEFAPANVHFYAFSLFMGIAMSITAFPVLARIIRERGLSGTRLGNIAIACAATDDITAWCLLTIVLTIVKGRSAGQSIWILLSVVAYVSTMLFIIRPLLKKILNGITNDKIRESAAVPWICVLLLLSAWASEMIGVHFLFGAFLAGIIMPVDGNFRAVLASKVGDVVLMIMLPLFFVFTGLRTQIGLLNTPMHWFICLLITIVATAGKFGGSAIAGRCMGESVKDSLSIGILMNTRGLVELVVLNIGYDMGILTARLFTMMVLMALFTTFMTSPGLSLIDRMKDRVVIPHFGLRNETVQKRIKIK